MASWMRLIVVGPVKNSVVQSSPPQAMFTARVLDGADVLAVRVDDPDAAGAGAVDVALDVHLHAVGRAGAVVAAHVAEQALAAEVEHAVAFDVVGADVLAVAVAVVDVEDLLVRREREAVGVRESRARPC